MADASGPKIGVLETLYYTSGVKAVPASYQPGPGALALWLIRHQGDFGLGLHLAGMVDAGAGAGASDHVVHDLGAGLRRADEQAVRKRNGIEAFSRARPCA